MLCIATMFLIDFQELHCLLKYKYINIYKIIHLTNTVNVLLFLYNGILPHFRITT